jgi:foldase protein PrsA
VRRWLALTVLPVVIAACGGSSGNAATFNGKKISNASFERELNALRDNKQLIESAKQSGVDIVADGKVVPALAAQWLLADLNQIPVDEEFARRKLTITPALEKKARSDAANQLGGSSAVSGDDVLNAFPKWFQDLLVGRQARVEALLNAYVVADGFADDAAWLAANPAAATDYCASGKVVRHVLVKTREEALEVQRSLVNGADFATVAKEKSTDAGSKDDAGFVGCLTQGQFVPPFEQAATALPIGVISDPVQTEFGFHVLRVDTFGVASAPQIVGALRQRPASDQFSKWLDEQMTNAKITVNPKWGTVSRDNGFRVLPPTSSTTTTKAPASSAPQSSTTSSSTSTTSR